MSNAPTDWLPASEKGSRHVADGRSIDSELSRVIAAQSHIFENAMQTIEQLHQGVNLRNAESLPDIGKLQTSLEQITLAQSRVAAAHHDFQQSGRPMSIGLQDELHRHENILRHLLERFAGIQHLFEAARKELIPQLDEDTRRRCMHSAYQRSLKTI